MTSRSTSIYEPQLQVPRAEMPSLVSGSVGASAAAHAGDVLRGTEKKLREEGAAWAANTITGLRSEYLQRLAQGAETGEAGAGFADDLRGDFAKRIEELRKDVPPYAEGAFNAGAADIYNTLGTLGREVEAKARRRLSEAEVEAALDNLTSLAETDFDTVEHAILEATAIMRAAKPTAEARPRLEAKLQRIPVAGLIAVGKRDPGGLVRLFESGAARPYFADPETHRAAHRRAKSDALRHGARESAKAASSSTRAMLDAQAQIDLILAGDPASDYREPDPEVLGPERAQQLKKEMDEAQARVQRDAENLDNAANAITSGKGLNAQDPSHRRGGNTLYKDHVAPELEDLPEEEQRRRKIDFITMSGFVPDQVRDEINADLRAADLRRVVEAAEFVHALDSRDDALGNVFDDADRDLARGANALRRAGFDGAAAVKRILEGRELKGSDLAGRMREFERASKRGDAGVVANEIREALGIPATRQLRFEGLSNPSRNRRRRSTP